MKLKRIFSISIILVLTMSLLAGCATSSSGSSSGSGNGLKVLFVCRDISTDSFLTSFNDSLMDVAAANGVTVDTAFSDSSSVEEQMLQIADAKDGGYDAIICVLTDVSTALQAEVSTGDIPIVFVNSSPDDDCLDAEKYVYVGSPETETGNMQAEYVWNALGKPSTVNAVMMMGQEGHPAVIARTQGVSDFFKENGVTVNFVFQDYASWATDTAQEKFDIFLKTNQSYDCVFCNNDSMALGVVQSMKSHGIDPKSIPIAGSDGTTDGCQMIEDGYMIYSGYQSAQGQAEKSIEAVIALKTQGSIKDVDGVNETGYTIDVPYEAITKDNVASYK